MPGTLEVKYSLKSPNAKTERNRIHQMNIRIYGCSTFDFKYAVSFF